MTIQDCAKQVFETKTCHLIRYRKDSLTETGTAHYDCKPYTCGSKRGWIYLDLFTAGAIWTVYQNLNPQNQAKFHKIPLPKLAAFCLSQVRAA